MKIMVMIILEVEVEIRNQRRREESRSRSNSRVSTNRDHMRCYQCREYDHFAAECPNTPTDEETDYEDIGPTSLQLISQTHGPVNSEGEDDYFKLMKGKNGSTPFFATKIKDRWKK